MLALRDDAEPAGWPFWAPGDQRDDEAPEMQSADVSKMQIETYDDAMRHERCHLTQEPRRIHVRDRRLRLYAPGAPQEMIRS
jgi:hypothetical protein